MFYWWHKGIIEHIALLMITLIHETKYTNNLVIELNIFKEWPSGLILSQLTGKFQRPFGSVIPLVSLEFIVVK